MIAKASVELSHLVSSSSTTLPLTVDGKIVFVGIVAGKVRSAPFAEFKRALDTILIYGRLKIEVGPFEYEASIAEYGKVGVVNNFPSVRRGDEVRMLVSVPEPLGCAIMLQLVVDVEEAAVKPDLN